MNKKKHSNNKITDKEWLAIRKKAGRKIDPETAEVIWAYGCWLDPYYIEPERYFDLQENGQGQRPLGDLYFARSPGSDIWVWFGDLHPATEKALREKHVDDSPDLVLPNWPPSSEQASLAFQAGLLKEIGQIMQSNEATM